MTIRSFKISLLALLAALLIAPVGSAQELQLESRTFNIARQLRCPVCTSESAADSNAQIAQQMRALIQDQLEEGKSEEEIFAYFQARYGDWIMLNPPKRGIHLLAWLLPLVAAIVAVSVVAILARRWLAAARAPIVVSEEELARVRAQLSSEDPNVTTPITGPRSGPGEA